jgi:hypothetical protein
MADPHETITELRRIADLYAKWDSHTEIIVKVCRDAAVVIEERLAFEKHQAESWQAELDDAADRIGELVAALRVATSRRFGLGGAGGAVRDG